jgi:hypothetical protein
MLLAKYSAAFRQIQSEFPDIEKFVHKYKVNIPSQSLNPYFIILA